MYVNVDFSLYFIIIASAKKKKKIKLVLILWLSEIDMKN